jgi:hypothetical protein
MLPHGGDAKWRYPGINKSKRLISKIKQHTKTYKTPKILRITVSLGSFYGRRRHFYQPGCSWVAGTSTLKRGSNVMIWHFTNPFQTFHGGFIPYANGLFHKPNPHPPGLFHNSCAHNNTGRITLTTPIGLFNNLCFQSLERIGIKTLGSTKRIGTHPCVLIETPTYSNTPCVLTVRSIDSWVKYNI